MGSIRYCCPNCDGTSFVYDYGSKMILCAKCRTPIKDFERDFREFVAQRL